MPHGDGFRARGIEPSGSSPTSLTSSGKRTASGTRTQAGLGLGLSIVRHLVELHGGMIQAFSEGEGKGATFTVSLFPFARWK